MYSVRMKPGERLAIGGDVELEITREGEGVFQVSVKAPRGTPVTKRDGGGGDRARAMARDLVNEMPLPELCRDREQLGSFISELVFQILSSADEIESENRRRHQKQCIDAAKARGVRFGPARLELPPEFREVAELWGDGVLSGVEAAERLGVSRRTFVRRAKEYLAQPREAV